MLRNRSRAVTRKQATVMDENSLLSSPSQNHTRPISSFFGPPRFFNGFFTKSAFHTETMSPTSVLDTKTFSAVAKNPFGYDKDLTPKFPTTFPGNKHSSDKSDPEPIGLALIDDNISKPNSPKVLFGSKLKIQIPQFPPSVLSLPNSPKSPAEFGIKTRKSQCSSPFGTRNTGTQTRTNGYLTVSEMEISEDYTCVINHGPNPTTTHIYDNCIVKSCCGSVTGSSKLKNAFSKKPNSSSKNFLSFCYTCKKNLGQGKDIFMYRGERAFCSRECRFQEMMLDGEKDADFGG